MMKPKRHVLETKTQYFSAVCKGMKTIEIRYNDRDFQTGDHILLREVDRLGNYTGREIQAEITYLTDYEQKDHFIVFSFKKRNEKEYFYETIKETHS